MGFGEAISTCFKKYAVFNGRARRSEYWWFALFVFLVEFVAVIIEMGGRIVFLSSIISLGLLLPQISVAVRRLHDINRSGWWIGGIYIFLLMLFVAMIAFADIVKPDPMRMPPGFGIAMAISGLVGFIYAITLFVFAITKGTDGPNGYGPDPLASI